MNIAKGLTDKAVALLENAVIHVLAKAHQLGCASISTDDIGKTMGTYYKWEASNSIHTAILNKLEAEKRVVVLC